PYLEIFGELHVDTALSSQAFGSATTPTEVLLGIGGRVRGWHARAAIGVGAVQGYGDPRVRAVITIGYAAKVEPRPARVEEPEPPLARAPRPPEPRPEAEPEPEFDEPRPS